MDTPTFPVAIVGAGPTGLTLAHLLTAAGIRTVIIDRLDGPVNEPRAVTIDDESLRTLQSAGVLAEVLPRISQDYGVYYYSWRNRLFARILPANREYGYAKRNAFRQPVLVAQLTEALRRSPLAELRFNSELKSFQQDEAGVTLQIEHQGKRINLRCAWLVGCDGGRSPIREALDIPMEGSTFGERWLIVDMLDRTTPFRHTRTFCDPRRPAIRLPGPDGTLRYEFMLLKGENPEDVLDEERVRTWIREREPEDANLPVTRMVVYTFHARVAQRWRKGRVFLAGDAAHLSPPFAGQGMNSGIRDAANLAWKLAAVINGQLPPELLDTYEQERRPHAGALIKMALQIGRFMQPKSVLGAAFAQTTLRLLCLIRPVRDYILHLKFKPKPRFADGYFTPHNLPSARVPPGELMPQPLVEQADGKRVLLDDVLGREFAVLQWVGADVHISLPAGMSVRYVHLVRHDDDFLPGHEKTTVRDCTGILGEILDSARASAVVLRPDRYVYAYF